MSLKCSESYANSTIGNFKLACESTLVSVEDVSYINRALRLSIPPRCIIKATFSYVSYTVWYLYTRNTATVERLRTNARHAVWNRNICKTIATIECAITNAFNTVSYRYYCKIFATVECHRINVRHAVRNNHTHQAFTISESTGSDILYSIRYGNLLNVICFYIFTEILVIFQRQITVCYFFFYVFVFRVVNIFKHRYSFCVITRIHQRDSLIIFSVWNNYRIEQHNY